MSVLTPKEFSTTTVRCLGCRNRIGLNGATILEDGSVCCSSACGKRRQMVHAVHGRGAVELIG